MSELEARDLRAETAALVRRRYADLAREGHAAPMDAVRAEALDRIRKAMRTLRPVVACSVAVGIDDALSELELTRVVARAYPELCGFAWGDGVRDRLVACVRPALDHGPAHVGPRGEMRRAPEHDGDGRSR